MALRGERFHVDLSSDDEGDVPAGPSPLDDFVGDIKERDVTSARPPSAPVFKGTTSGFPEHKKRTRVSAFKSQRAGATTARLSSASPARASAPLAQTETTANPQPLTRNNASFEETERRRIDEENTQRLADMSPEEIDQERQELLSGLNPSLIERLLKRANLDDGRGDTGTLSPEELARSGPSSVVSPEQADDAMATVIPPPNAKRLTAAKTVTFEDDTADSERVRLEPSSLETSSPFDSLSDPPAVHFPVPPIAADLDPSDPNFLESLHSKYFPSLPADPSKLAWMAPLPTNGSIADQESPYHPAQEGLPASALRFDFRGGILPPRIARAMPVTRGLHHHGEAPEAAGYTIPELARLARSVFPAQRCVAFQTLGRLLYRLGRGEWGEGSEISQGLWRCMEEGKVIQTLEEASSAEGGHQGSKVYAVEAAWLWQKGGGQVWKAA